MWRMMPRLAIAALTATLSLAGPSVPTALAAASVQTFAYSTSGDIAGMTGDTPVQFLGQPDTGTNTLTTPGSFILGMIQASPLPSSATLTYNNTPFTIDLIVHDYQPPVPGLVYPTAFANYADYKISGVFNGSITGAGASSMYATVTSIDATIGGYTNTPPFPVEDLKISVPQGITAPNGPIDGYSLLTAQVVIPGFPLPPAAPEPTSIAAFAAALAGWALRRKLRRAA